MLDHLGKARAVCLPSGAFPHESAPPAPAPLDAPPIALDRPGERCIYIYIYIYELYIYIYIYIYIYVSATWWSRGDVYRARIRRLDPHPHGGSHRPTLARSGALGEPRLSAVDDDPLRILADRAELATWRAGMDELAALPNVYVKVTSR